MINFEIQSFFSGYKYLFNYNKMQDGIYVSLTCLMGEAVWKGCSYFNPVLFS